MAHCDTLNVTNLQKKLHLFSKDALNLSKSDSNGIYKVTKDLYYK